MERTENYQLCLWDPEDKVLRTDFNEDNEKIERALKKKAEQSALDTLEKQMAEKAEKTAHDALAGQVTALEQGRLRYKFDSYTGNGTAGKNNPTQLEFDFKPLMLLIVHPTSQIYGGFPWLRGMRCGHSYLNTSGSTSYMYLTWEERAVQWYSYYSNASGGDQLNAEGTTYWYFALGIAE